MHALSSWPAAERARITGVFTDIDDTLTTDGAVPPDTLQALHTLKAAGLHVVAITGRPVGWAQARASNWPVDAVVVENGAVALVPSAVLSQIGMERASPLEGSLSKLYQQDAAERASHAARMRVVAARVLREVPGVALSSDSDGRETDLAFDYHEHARLPPETVEAVLAVLRNEGMVTSVSSIHIHGCYSRFDKWQGACWIVRTLWGRGLAAELDRWVFVGDSGNDEAMFQHFIHSVGVANVARFVPQLTHLPRFVAPSERSKGFNEVVQALLAAPR